MNKKDLALTQSLAQRLDDIATYLLQQEETSGQNAYYVDADIIASGYISKLRNLSAQATQELLACVDLFATQFAVFEKRIVGNGEAIYFLNEMARNCMFSGGFVTLWKRQQEGEKVAPDVYSRVCVPMQPRQNWWHFLSAS
ncbi:hypothetical protein BKI52_42385 [marine bacterium AO1-C]|nr:hypothetical protein BKI52_42385 [marine bacterium AO1-C]